MVDGRVLWTPPEELIRTANLTRFCDVAAPDRVRDLDYRALWKWSTNDIAGFWGAVWSYFDLGKRPESADILPSRAMPGARWFEGAHLNYASLALADPDDRLALISVQEDGVRRELTRAELAAQVGAAAAGLRRLGVGPGDRVAAYLPNAPEAVVGFLAAASIGAIWSSCSPDFGPRAVIDRFRQIEPSVLIAAEGYSYGGRWFDRRAAVREILAELPRATCVMVSPTKAEGLVTRAGDLSWDDLVSIPESPTFEHVAFDHPLWILFSSGTTGLPKSMVQGHGGIVLEHLKSLSLHLDLGPKDRFFWFTTTGWMMWNFLVSGLLVGSTIVLYDGSPAYPDLGGLWRLVESTDITYFGASAPFLHASMRAAVQPRATNDLSGLRAIGSTGAPLSAEGFEWVFEHVGAHIWLGSISGGTDLCTAVVGSCPWLPVRSGEIQCRALGAKVEAFDAEGRSVVDELGELVITEPMPSMPVSFWNDPDGDRYRASYFESYPGVWRHGDWITIRPSGSCVISGRSDATLNRGGVRVGTSEFYRVVESIEGIAGSLVVDTGDLDHEGAILLFVVLDGAVLDDGLRARIASELRSQLSPRHVPDLVVEAPGVPTTLNGKRLEVPVKRMLMGEPADRVASPESLQDVTIFEWFATYAGSHAGDDPARR